jgi:two-component system, NtrC family, sensor kinase
LTVIVRIPVRRILKPAIARTTSGPLVRRLREGLQFSVRSQLLFMVLLPLIVVLPILVALVLYWGNSAFNTLLIFKVNSDLAVAHEYFVRVKDGVGGRVAGLAGSGRLAAALAARKPEPLKGFLSAARAEHGLDFLQLLDPEGSLIASASELVVPANYARWPVVAKAIGGDPGAAVDVFPPEWLADLDVRLRERALIPILPTRNAAPTDLTQEERGLVIHAAAPVYNDQGRLVAVLQGGELLNRNLEFVDTINTLVYREGSLPSGSRGTATLFLDDVRIATNVRLFEGARALGTRVSREVRDKVLEKGEVWLDRAFVVNDWYVSGYEPVLDSFGKRVGMLYVGFLDAPFESAKRQALAAIELLFVLISVLGSVLSLRWARRIFRPLERMDNAMSAVEAGEAGARVGPIASRDEIGRLAAHFDRLLDNLESRSRELQRSAGELDVKVAERTRELEAANRSLRETQRQLVISEKLAALGHLSAGFAHEINNPVAMIQGNLDMLKELLGPAAQPVAGEIRLIDEQVNRIREIVTRLLQFARPAEYAGYVEDVDVNEAAAYSLLLVRHLTARHGIRVVSDCRATRRAGINRGELQQVIVNLLVNAIHAMPGGGTLTVTARDWEHKGVVLGVRDTGTGIRPEDLPRIFDPFFTTKKQEGTGLGLSISYTLVERYGGSISVESAWRKGAEFSVWLLSEPSFRGESRAAAPVV